MAGYVAPFAAFISVMALEHVVPLPMLWAYPLRLAVTFAALVLFSRPYLGFRPSASLASIILGIIVFLVWIGPDLLFHYRHHWLFSNSVLGAPVTNIPPELQRSPWFLLLRTAGCALLVPVIEELFWRGWLMRWLIDKEFLKVPLGAYAPSAFWMVALLFGSEHGPYWEVGLVTGVLYNWWVIRTKNLADCILAHAVTNACLSAYVLATGNWQYWL
jgi:CAAX prenyl protease-like protein